MYGGESCEAGHVRLGPVQGVEPVAPPHQHPSRVFCAQFNSFKREVYLILVITKVFSRHLSPVSVAEDHPGRSASSVVLPHQPAIPLHLPSN